VFLRLSISRAPSRLTGKETLMPHITACLWFNGQAEDAANFYVSIFKNSKITQVSRFGEGTPMPAGSVMVVAFEIENQSFCALNGGPQYKFSEATSFQIPCETQQEIDYYWNKLTEGGEPGPCGWLKDKFGVSWQVFPSVLPSLMSGGGDAEKGKRVMQKMMSMKKIELAALQNA
jgi:predicted 3-demethylubiquinone-9 3-methyltransferase (glyoxalase superfamily)